MASRTGLLQIAALVVGLALPQAARAGLVATGNHRITQGDLGGAVEAGDHFGAALATGDFDGDGFADLAIGVPDEEVGSIADAGQVIVVYGSAGGLGRGARAPLGIYQDVSGVLDTAEEGDRFGAAVAAGDFNGDGYDDLAVGVPGESWEDGTGISIPHCGAVQVFLGTAAGIVAAIDSFWFMEDTGLSSNRLDSALGSALASCDRFHDGYDDLIIGVPGEDYLFIEQSGAVIEMHGSSAGLDETTSGYWGGASTDPAVGDRFGSAIACDRLTQSIFPEVVVGAPYANATGADSGLLRLILANDELTITTAGARLGTAVAIGDFAGKGYGQLFGGAPGRNPGPPGGATEAGEAHHWDRLLPSHFRLFQGANPFIPEVTEPFDHFGEVLTVGDFDGDGRDDAVVGIPGENLADGSADPTLDAGVVQVFYGDGSGLGRRNELWSFNSPGIAFGALANDHFGGAVAAGDFNGDGEDDLAIAAPTAEWSGQAGTGLLQILYGAALPLVNSGFEPGNLLEWTTRYPP